MFGSTSWRQRALSEVRGAQRVLLASYVYDDPYFQAVLLEKLQARGPFALEVWVDEKAFKAGWCTRQRTRLLALREKGAKVFLCEGRNEAGIFHVKALVVDKEVAYWGGQNTTFAGQNHWELMQRVTGHPVQEILEIIWPCPRKALRVRV